MLGLFDNYTGWNSIQKWFNVLMALVVLHIITGCVYYTTILLSTSDDESWRRNVYPFQVLFHFFWGVSFILAEAVYSLWILVVLQCIYLSLDTTLGLYDVSTTQRVTMFLPSLGLLILLDALMLWVAIRALKFCYRPLGQITSRPAGKMRQDTRSSQVLPVDEPLRSPNSDTGPLAEAFRLQSSSNYGTVGTNDPGQPSTENLEDTDPDDILPSPNIESPPKRTRLWVHRPISHSHHQTSESSPLLHRRPTTTSNLNAHHIATDEFRFDILLLCISILSIIHFSLALFSTIRWHILGHLHLISHVYLLVFLAPLLSLIWAIIITTLLYTSRFQHALLQRRQTRIFSFVLAIVWVNSMWFDRHLQDGPPTLARICIAVVEMVLCFVYAGTALFPRREWERAWVVVDENETVVERRDMHGGWRRGLG